MNDEILPTRITAIKNGEIIEGLSTRPEIASRPNEWRGAVFEEHQLPPQYVEPETMTQHFVAVPLNHDRRKVLWKVGGKESHIDLDPGSVTIHAAGDEASVLWKQPMHIMAVVLDPDGFPGGNDRVKRRVELPSVMGVVDPTTASLIQVLRADALSQHPSGKLFGESVLQALKMHLMTKYGQPTSNPRAALAPRTLRKVIDYIEANLSLPLTLADIAGSVGLSPYHLNRSFRQATGHSIWAYVLKRRVDRSKELMHVPSISLLEVAQSVGFDSYGQFIAAFRKNYGSTPNQYRREL